MVKMNFENSVLEKMIRRWKWSRKNSLLLFEAAEEQNILSYTPKGLRDNHEHHSVLYQFQCLVTTVNTYYRRIINDRNQNFGVLVINGKIIPKEQISKALVFDQLELQIPLGKLV